MEKTIVTAESNDDEKCLIKVYECYGEELPILRYQLSAKGREEYRRLLKRLELLSEFLPYLTEAEEKARQANSDLEYHVVLENLKTAVQLGII